jgi:hypothetical protein
MLISFRRLAAPVLVHSPARLVRLARQATAGPPANCIPRASPAVQAASIASASPFVAALKAASSSSGFAADRGCQQHEHCDPLGRLKRGVGHDLGPDRAPDQPGRPVREPAPMTASRSSTCLYGRSAGATSPNPPEPQCPAGFVVIGRELGWDDNTRRRLRQRNAVLGAAVQVLTWERVTRAGIDAIAPPRTAQRADAMTGAGGKAAQRLLPPSLLERGGTGGGGIGKMKRRDVVRLQPSCARSSTPGGSEHTTRSG